MEEIEEVISRYGLDEDREHVIIPVRDARGSTRRIFLLKRRFMRIMYPEGQYVDYPMAEVIEATVRYPDLLLSEALYLMHKESDEGRKDVQTEDRATDKAERTTRSQTITERD